MAQIPNEIKQDPNWARAVRISKTVCCKHVPSYLGIELYKRVECGRGKVEKIGVWEYGRERSNSQIKGNNRL